MGMSMDIVKRRTAFPGWNNMKQHPDQENANIRDLQRGTEDPSDHETGAQTESLERKDSCVSEWTHEDIISAFKHERDRAFTANRTCRELRAERDTARAHLRKYGEHSGCPCEMGGVPDSYCTCGFAAALEDCK